MIFDWLDSIVTFAMGWTEFSLLTELEFCEIEFSLVEMVVLKAEFELLLLFLMSIWKFRF